MVEGVLESIVQAVVWVLAKEALERPKHDVSGVFLAILFVEQDFNDRQYGGVTQALKDRLAIGINLQLPHAVGGVTWEGVVQGGIHVVGDSLTFGIRHWRFWRLIRR